MQPSIHASYFGACSEGKNMAVFNDNVVIDGVSTPNVYGEPIEWDDFGYIGQGELFVDPADEVNLVASLEDDWYIGSLVFGGDGNLSVVFNDSNDGGNRDIDMLRFVGSSEDFELNLTTTRIRVISGGDGGNHTIRLGAERTSMIELFGGTNNIYLGDRDVESVSLGDGDDYVEGSNLGGVRALVTRGGNDEVIVKDRGFDSIRMGDGNDTLEAGNGFINYVEMGEGNDTVTLGAGGAGSIQLGSGVSSITTGTGFVEFIGSWGDGAKTVVANGGVGAMRLSDEGDTVTLNSTTDFVNMIDLKNGDNTVNVSSNVNFGVVRANDGNDTIQLGANANANDLNLSGGNNIYRIDDGRANSVVSYQGDDTLRIYSGRAESVNLGRCNLRP